MLLVINEDRVTFLNKSVKDWLVKSEHEFTADKRLDHETLAEICAKEMDEIKMNGIEPPFRPATKYALPHDIQRKMAGTQETLLKTYIDTYLLYLELMYACVIVDVYGRFNNIVSLKNNRIYGS